MPTSQEMKVEQTFVKAQDQINNLQKVFRDEGLLAKAVVDIGGNQDFGAIQEAFDNLYGALEDAHYDAMAHIEVESAKQKLGMNKEPVAELKTGDDVKEDDEEIQAIPAKVVELAGDSIWDRDGSNPKSVKVSKVSIVGAGMVSTPGVTYRMFRALSEEGINILAISTSEIKLSVIIEEEKTLNAIKKLHTIFDLD